MPTPAIAHAMSAPTTPVDPAKAAGSENTPAPTIEPTTIALSVQTPSFAAGALEARVVVSLMCGRFQPVSQRGTVIRDTREVKSPGVIVARRRASADQGEAFASLRPKSSRT